MSGKDLIGKWFKSRRRSIGGSSSSIQSDTRSNSLSSLITEASGTSAEDHQDQGVHYENQDLVPVDFSAKGVSLITDANSIKHLANDSKLRSRLRLHKKLPKKEPWFNDSKPLPEIENYLQSYGALGNFFVTPILRDDILIFILTVKITQKTIKHFEVLYRLHDSMTVYFLKNSSLKFPTISALVQFLHLNLLKPLPCYLHSCTALCTIFEV